METPETLYEAVEEGIKIVKKEAPSQLPAEDYHHTFGRWIRNNWGLWDKESKLHKWFKTNMRIWHADDMSGLIIHGITSHLMGKDPDYNKKIKQYRLHWTRSGIDPLSGETLGGC